MGRTECCVVCQFARARKISLLHFFVNFMAKLIDHNKFKGVNTVYRDKSIRLSRAIDLSTGVACWLYQSQRPVTQDGRAQTDSHQAMRSIRQSGVLTLMDFGHNERDQGFLSVSHCSAQPLPELFQQKPVNEVLMLQVLLALARILPLLEDNGVGHRYLHPAFIFVKTANFATIEDITERRKAERNLQLAISLLIEILSWYIKDEEGNNFKLFFGLTVCPKNKILLSIIF